MKESSWRGCTFGAGSEPSIDLGRHKVSMIITNDVQKSNRSRVMHDRSLAVRAPPSRAYSFTHGCAHNLIRRRDRRLRERERERPVLVKCPVS